MVKNQSKKNTKNVNSQIGLVIKSGKYTFGIKTTFKSLRSGKSKMVIISNNCLPLKRSEIEYYAMLSKTPVYHYSGNNMQLGMACGKLHNISVLSITDAGDSDIVKEIITSSN